MICIREQAKSTPSGGQECGRRQQRSRAMSIRPTVTPQ